MSNKGFQNFVNSILHTKDVNSKKNKKSGGTETDTKQDSNEQPAEGDLAIINMINGRNEARKKEATIFNRPKSLGLGFDKNISQSELEALNQVDKLKKQINSKQEARQQAQTKYQDKEQLSGSKYSVQKKSGNSDPISQIIDKKMQNKRQKKEKEKQKQQNKQQNNINKQVEQNVESEQEQNDAYEQEEQPKQQYDEYHYDKDSLPQYKKRTWKQCKFGKTKTRSRQKNIKKDKRPEDDKKRILSEKGITV